MAGISLRDGELVVGREPNRLDDLAIGFSSLLDELGVGHVFVAGYVAILACRARSTEDINVIVEPLSAAETSTLVERLRERNYWGPAMPLDSMYENLEAGTNIWVAPDGEMTPHLEVKFPTDEFDRASLSNAIDARIGDETVPIGPLELGIAYKLYLGGQKDFEDAAHLYTLFGESLSTAELETWAERLSVTDRYDRLRNA